MAEIDVRIQVNAPQEKVWNVISKVDNDPNYWKGITSIRNISKDRNVITREVTLVNGSKSYQKVILFPKEGIHIRFMKGPIIGIKDILLVNNGNVTILEAQLDYKSSGLTRLIPKSILEELQFEAELALQLIKEEVEEKPSRFPKEKRKLWADLIND
ncbi:MAG: SRPBCC family protein [Nitrosotalea sp.]